MDREKNIWNTRYAKGGNSGSGSYGEQLNKKLKWLSPLTDIDTITEVGCGDFNFGKELVELFANSKYTGSDISDFIIQKNKILYPEHTFEVYNGEIPPADLLLCVDVLFHVLDDNEAEELLLKLEKSWTKYLVITAYERAEPKYNHVRIRKLDYKRFGEPILRELLEEDQLYFYIWKR